MAAIGLYRGPRHVIEYMNGEMIDAFGGVDWTGVPVCEAFPDEVFLPVQRMMNSAYRSGRAVSVRLPAGVLWVVPTLEAGSVVGVGTHFEQSPSQPLPLAEPVPLEQAG